MSVEIKNLSGLCVSGMIWGNELLDVQNALGYFPLPTRSSSMCPHTVWAVQHDYGPNHSYPVMAVNNEGMYYSPN